MTKEQQTILEHLERLFLPKALEAFADNLRSVTVYGSVVTERFTPGISDANVLIVLGRSDPEAILALGKSTSGIMRKNRITPLLLTESEFLGSADVFPMEYLDIVDSRKVIFGDDLAVKLDITNTNLRHQIEEQLRGSISSLRSALLGTRGRAGMMRRILRDWFGSQNALFRGLLRLSGSDPIPSGAYEVISQLKKAYDIDVDGLENAAKLRAGEKIDAIEAAKAVLRCFTALAEKIDAMET